MWSMAPVPGGIQTIQCKEGRSPQSTHDSLRSYSAFPSAMPSKDLHITYGCLIRMTVIGPLQLHSSSTLTLGTVTPGSVKQFSHSSSTTGNNQKEVLRIWTLQRGLQPLREPRDPDMTLAATSYIEGPLYETIALETACARHESRPIIHISGIVYSPPLSRGIQVDRH